MIQKVTNANEVILIAQQNPHYFNEAGLKLVEKDLAIDDVYGHFDGGKLTGFISVKKIPKDSVEISWMALSPKYQDKGIGTALVEHVCKEYSGTFSHIRVKTLAHTVPDDQYARTRQFYRKNGFVSIQVIDPYPAWGEGNPCEIFTKEL